MKRITIITYGTRGDVTPLVCLASALRAHGMKPTLVMDREFSAEAVQRSLPVHEYSLQFKDLFLSDHGKEAIESEFRVKKQRDLNRSYHERIRAMLDTCWEAAQDADLLIYQGDLFAPVHIAEALDIPCMMTSAIPNLSPTNAFPLIGAPWFGDFRLTNRMSYGLYPISWFQVNPRLRAWCRDSLGVKPPSRFRNYFRCHRGLISVMYSYSESLVPSPVDWNGHTRATGFWMMPDEDYIADNQLAEFLRHGEPPVYFSFGSTVGLDPDRAATCVMQAIEQLGIRAVVNVGWGGVPVPKSDERIFVLDNANYDWLFPQVSAVVCHGGVGTIAYALVHQRPVITCPFMTDQFFWSRRVESLGVGAEAAPLREITTDDLVRAIQATLTDPQIESRVQSVGESIRQENGLDNAIRFIETCL